METEESRRIKFSVLISLQIPSIICYIGLIYHHTSSRHTLKKLHNHAPLALLFVGFVTVVIDLSMILNFLRKGIVTPSTDLYCRMWNFIDFLLYALLSILILWTTIERHILIFNHRLWLNTYRKRLFIHYAPLAFIFGYLFLFYIYIAFIHQCENHFDYNQVVCTGLCFVTDTILGIFDQFAHTIVPSILIVISNMVLWFRILWKRHYRMRQAMEWRRHRKILLQFIPISILYLCGYVPFGFIECYHMIHGPTILSVDIQQLYFFYLFYVIDTVHPFVCLIGMHDLYMKWFHRRNQSIMRNSIHPVNRMIKV